MVEKYKVLCEGDSLYNIIRKVENNITTTSLYYGDRFTGHKDSPVLSMIDDGNGFRFTKALGKNMDYQAALELRLLLSLDQKLEKCPEYYEVYKETEAFIL